MRTTILKSLLMAWAMSGIGNSLAAQNDSTKNALTYKFVSTDYNSLDPDYQAAQNPNRYFHPDDVNYAVELGYFRYLNASFNLGLPFRIGSVDMYQTLNAEGDSTCQPCARRFYQTEFYTGVDVVGVYKFANGYILPLRSFFAPYLVFGVGAAYFDKHSKHIDVQIPMGLGANVRIHPKLHFQAQMEYRASLVLNKQNVHISAGLLWGLK